MSKGTITDKQREILEYIKSQILERGFPPAVREICEAVNLKSTSSVHSHLETLERNGYIHRDPTKPRAIEILDDEFNLLRREVVNVPLIGRVAAGEPLLAQENIENYFPIPVEMMPNKPVDGYIIIKAGIRRRLHQTDSRFFTDLLFFLQLRKIYMLSVSPDTFQIIEQTVFFVENMDDDLAEIHQHPVSGAISFSLFHFISGF